MASNKEQDLDFTKYGQREVSQFMGRELIYDYITGKLDKDRHKAVEKYVMDTKDAQGDMMNMLNGIQYTELLSETRVAEAIVNRISEPSGYIEVLLKKLNFQNWPTSVKWAMEAMIVVSFVVAISIFIPWDQVSRLNPFPESRQAILAEIDRYQPVGDPGKLKQMESAPAEFADDDKLETEVVSKAEPKAPAEKSTKPEVVVAAAGEKASKKPEETPATETLASKPKEKKANEGFLHRGSIFVTNLEMVGPKIRDKIVELGGRKAGKVELGWKRSARSSYFHFTLPEAKYEELDKFLMDYGQLNIEKEKHPRVMPDGIIRLIITVNEAKQ